MLWATQSHLLLSKHPVRLRMGGCIGIEQDTIPRPVLQNLFLIVVVG